MRAPHTGWDASSRAQLGRGVRWRGAPRLDLLRPKRVRPRSRAKRLLPQAGGAVPSPPNGPRRRPLLHLLAAARGRLVMIPSLVVVILNSAVQVDRIAIDVVERVQVQRALIDGRDQSQTCRDGQQRNR